MSRWIRKSELDARIGRDTPVPTEVTRNADAGFAERSNLQYGWVRR